jgi:hypothetical protein
LATPECSDAASHGAALLAPDEPARTEVETVLATHCQNDGWSRDVRLCIANADTHEQLRVCGEQELSHEDHDKVAADLAPLIQH